MYEFKKIFNCASIYKSADIVVALIYIGVSIVHLAMCSGDTRHFFVNTYIRKQGHIIYQEFYKFLKLVCARILKFVVMFIRGGSFKNWKNWKKTTRYF